MKLILISVLLVSLVLCSSFLQCTIADPQPYSPKPAPAVPNFCDSKCAERCEKAGYQRRCLKYCGICCQECKCVPSGTYGNKSECPCYRDKLSSKGTPKCP